MQPKYTMAIEPQRRLLRVRMSGFFALEDVAALEADRRSALARLGCARNQHITLVDVSDCKLQSQEVVGAFQTALSEPRYSSRRIAFVTGSSLARMQVRRMLTREGADFFDHVDAAEAWLFERISPRATGVRPGADAQYRPSVA